jgi:hypothetical protein
VELEHVSGQTAPDLKRRAIPLLFGSPEGSLEERFAQERVDEADPSLGALGEPRDEIAGRRDRREDGGGAPAQERIFDLAPEQMGGGRGGNQNESSRR